MHIDAKPEEIVTSALATANFIANEKANASVYMIGGSGLTYSITRPSFNIKTR